MFASRGNIIACTGSAPEGRHSESRGLLRRPYGAQYIGRWVWCVALSIPTAYAVGYILPPLRGLFRRFADRRWRILLRLAHRRQLPAQLQLQDRQQLIGIDRLDQQRRELGLRKGFDLVLDAV